MKSMIYVLISIMLAATAAVPADIKARAEAVITIDRNQQGDPVQVGAAIRESFRLIEERELEPRLLKTYDTRTLEILFEAVAIASDRLKEPTLLTVLEDVFQECVSRGFVGNMIDQLYMRYIQARELGKVRKLNERFPSKARELPDIVEPDAGPKEGPAVYAISHDGRTLTYMPVDLTGPMIVSVVSPGCHFSRDVVAEIESDPKLSKLFTDHAINIEPAPYRLDAGELARINRNGKFRYTILYREAGWKGFTFSAIPRFYFVRHGKIVHEIDDVTPQDLRAKLAEGLKKVGLSVE
jgi:hypothetical protein